MNSDDLRLAAIIKEGEEGDVVIVGSPFDYARKRCISKGGEDNGPCCLRRFFGRVGPIVNPEYGISLEQVKLSDYGNIKYKEEKNTHIPEKCIEAITAQIYELLEKDKFPFVYGGSKESLLGSSIAFHKKYTHTRHILISGKPNLNRPYDHDKLTSENILTLLNEKHTRSVLLFAAHQQYFPKEYSADLFENLTYEEIRKAEYNKGGEVYTQAGAVMAQLLQKS